MSTPEDRMNLFNQYRQVYGDLATTGLYTIGQRVYFDGGQIGEVIWKYHSANGLMYVLDDNTGFPTEERSQDIEGKAL
ncbi:hypothetical protein KSC_026710 [Ktedonobacter sp. SOSP1-52]|uniref:hypothetical protein n=1 Tax=Ktedonobacter sp. SOSP1-52 TaxID=2778366 RepID=UPI0019161C95|nr:hypothetical protein [Ktedonobacter sp. SOSP1-52]GHO63779.1 hypothetical protein KSC_026710 [Ktedonobacter sp. SOSP1-52]